MSKLCGYCNSALEEGFIHSGRTSFKWHKKDSGFIEKYTYFGGETLAQTTIVDCYRCKGCNKIIIDIEEIKDDGYL